MSAHFDIGRQGFHTNSIHAYCTVSSKGPVDADKAAGVTDIIAYKRTGSEERGPF